MKDTILYKKIYKLLMLGACVLSLPILLSCSDKDEWNDAEENNTYLIFGTSIDGKESATRAFDQTWVTTDEVGVFMTHTDYSAIAYGLNKMHKPDVGGIACTLKPNGAAHQLYYPVSGSDVRFIAYYPYQSTFGALGTYTISVPTVQTDANMKSSDFLYCKSSVDFNKLSATTPSLAFTHQLCKITVNVTWKSPEMNGATQSKLEVSLTNTPTSASFNLNNEALSGQTEKNTIALYAATAGSKFEGIVMPHASGTAFTERKLTFSFVDPTGTSVTLSHPIANSVVFTKNTAYTYHITLTRKGVEFTGCTIGKWTVGSGDNVTIGN